ncbi:ribonuclease T2 [Tepidamorphus gemmatus]|nr:ribonuclease T2 [Tepidamorphus gemmatus]
MRTAVRAAAATRDRMVLHALLLLAVIIAGPASAQRVGPNVPGDFDYYVLALSWSPSYCEAEATTADRLQCGGERPYHFVVHGLWPQYHRGWPEFCRSGQLAVPEQTVRNMLDIMPSPDLVRHQWQKHGTCSGLSAESYFALVRRARERIAIPPAFQSIDRHVMVAPQDVENAFRTANPGLPADAIAVTCDHRRLREVRICLDRTLRYAACPAVDSRACRLDRAVMPPVR